MSDPASSVESLPVVPDSLLWDVRGSEVSWQEHREFLIHRIMSNGTLELIRQLRRSVGDEELRQHLSRSRGRGLDRRRLRYFETILELPGDEVETWLGDPGRVVWDNR